MVQYNYSKPHIGGKFLEDYASSKALCLANTLRVESASVYSLFTIGPNMEIGFQGNEIQINIII